MTQQAKIHIPVRGDMLSKSFTIPSPCIAVHFLMGEPPPILLYCSWILGVRRLAMSGANLLQDSRVLTAFPFLPQSRVCLIYSTTLPTARSLPDSRTDCSQHEAWGMPLSTELNTRTVQQELLTFELEGSLDLCPGRDAIRNRGRHPASPGLPCSTSRFLF